MLNNHILKIYLVFLSIIFNTIHAQDIDSLLEDVQPSKVDVTEKNQSIIDRVNIPDILLNVDLVTDIGLQKGSKASNNFLPREIEFGFTGSVDHLMDATLILATHNELGVYNLELHEAYFELPYLPWNLNAKAGYFFINTGKLNNTHRHAWSFVLAPIVHERLFDPEGVVDAGAEISYLVHGLPFFLEILGGVFNGRTFGHSHTVGVKKPHPLYTLRVTSFVNTPKIEGLLLGFSFLRYSPTENKQDADYTFGTDLTIRWKKKEWALAWSSEAWYRYEERTEGVTENKYAGLYSYIDFNFLQYWYIGFRFDYYARVDFFSARQGRQVNLNSFQQTLWFTWKPSEFAYYRMSFERNDFDGEPDDYILRIQINFILGAHGAHKF